MDPSIIKLFEDDEDEIMHSGADVDAFTAALNRDIEGDTASDPKAGVLSNGGSSVFQQLQGQWQTSSQENNFAQQIQHQEENNHFQSTEVHSSQIEAMQTAAENEDQQINRQQDQLHWQSRISHSDRPQHPVTVPLQFDHNQVKVSEQNSMRCSVLNRPQPSESQNYNMQQLNSQQTSSADQANRTTPASIPINMLIPKLLCLLDKDRSMQLHGLYTKLRTQEITKDNFLRVCKSLVGGEMIKQAVHQVQLQGLHVQTARQTNQNQYSSRIHASAHQPHIQASTSQMQSDVSFSTLQNNGPNPRETENRTELQGGIVAQSVSSALNTVNAERESQRTPIQSVNQRQQIQVQQTSFPMYDNSSDFHTHAYPRPSVGAVTTSLKSQAQNSHMRQATFSQGKTSPLLGSKQPMNIVNVPRPELQNAANEARKLHPGSLSNLTNQQQRPVAWQPTSMPNREQRNGLFPSMACVKQELIDQDCQPQSIVSQGSSTVTELTGHGIVKSGPVKYERHEMKSTKISSCAPITAASQITGSGSNQAAPAAQVQSSVAVAVAVAGSTITPKKSSIGQKKTLEVSGNSPPHSGKKQKTSGSGTFADQSIEHLNDVTAVSGVNLREEEEHLLSAPREESQVSEAARRFVQQEEERLILQKEPLQKKLIEIISRCGIESKSNDVERCLSTCVEERLRGLISNMIRLSKQRLDIEKTKHQYSVTSDVQHEILMVNKKAKDEREKKQVEEAEKLRKLNETTEGNSEADANKDKDESRSKTQKINKEEDDKMRTAAANVAVRTAFGGDDMLSKWQFMADQARQKREGVVDGTTSNQQGKSAGGKSSTSAGGALKEPREAGKRAPSDGSLSGGIRKSGRRPGGISCQEVERVISTKDLIAILEREPQMSKSILIYRLYEKMSATE